MTVPHDLLFISEIVPQRLGSMHQQSAINKGWVILLQRGASVCMSQGGWCWKGTAGCQKNVIVVQKLNNCCQFKRGRLAKFTSRNTEELLLWMGGAIKIELWSWSTLCSWQAQGALFLHSTAAKSNLVSQKSFLAHTHLECLRLATSPGSFLVTEKLRRSARELGC